MSKELAPRQCSIRVLSCDHMELMDGSGKKKGICLTFNRHSAVPDSDREMSCGGGGGAERGEQSTRPLEKGGARSSKNFFGPSGLSSV